MNRPISLAELSDRLPEIAERVSRNPHSVEYISDPERSVDLALTTRSHIRHLEAIVAQLSPQAGTFVLAGSITLNCTDDEMEQDLAANRAAQNALFEAKLRSFSE